MPGRGQVYWSRADGDYSPSALREAFSGVGPVEDVVVRDSKKKKKGSAIVVMATAAGAAAAAASTLGKRANPLLVVPHSKAAARVPAKETQPPPAAPLPSAPLFPQAGPLPPPPSASASSYAPPPPSASSYAPPPPSASAPPGRPAVPAGQANSDYESVTLMKMRQAAERARLIREMEEAEAAGG